MNSNKKVAVKLTQPKQQITAPMSKSAKRRARNNPNRINSRPQLLMTPGPTYSGALMRPTRAVQNIRIPRLSKEGMGFLKCAFAPPDFSSDEAVGVPDGFTGKVLVKKHKLVAPITFDAGRDYYLLICPIPGVAYLQCVTSAGVPINSSSVFPETIYADSPSLFGPASGKATADKFTAFRTVSLCAELVPTTNAMSWSGNIQCFKFPVIQSMDTTGVVSGTPGLQLTVTGLESCNSTISNMYAAPFNLGVFASAGNMDPNFTFSPIVESMTRLPLNLDTSFNFGQLLGGNLMPYTGLGQTESILIKVSGLTTSCSALIKTWSCVEYKVNSVDPLYEYQSVSPREDKLAMECYRQILQSMPPGVSYFENAGLWERILNIIRTVSGGLSLIPGPYGGIARGVNLTSEALATLTL